jgi:bifunctional DNA-binding transcriptional regulator/antitoxin component of YhaV-PrlF toxin-antitoxin module
MRETQLPTPARVRKVDGGYEVFVPDDLAARTGISTDVVVEIAEMADMLMVRQEEFLERKRAEMWANFHPSQLHDPHEPYDPPPGYARSG